MNPKLQALLVHPNLKKKPLGLAEPKYHLGLIFVKQATILNVPCTYHAPSTHKINKATVRLS